MNCGRGFNKGVWLAALWLVSGLAVLAQSGDKAALEAERAAISEKIAATQKLLDDSKDDQKKTTRQLAILKEELALRQQLLSNLGSERRVAERAAGVARQHGNEM